MDIGMGSTSPPCWKEVDPLAGQKKNLTHLAGRGKLLETSSGDQSKTGGKCESWIEIDKMWIFRWKIAQTVFFFTYKGDASEKIEYEIYSSTFGPPPPGDPRGLGPVAIDVYMNVK